MAKKYYPSKSKNQKDIEQQELNKHMRFASVSAEKSKVTSTSSNAYTESRVKSMLQNIQSYGSSLGQFSKTMKQVNGVYKRIIKYLSSMLTYDHVLYPIIEDISSVNVDELNLAFNQKAIFLDRLNPRFYLPYITEKMFTQGATFLYKIEDKKGVAYMEFPISYCRISYIENGVYRYYFDITKVNTQTFDTYPPEIQSAFNSYNSGDNDKFIDNKWYQVSDKGVAFTLDIDVLSQYGVSAPPLANVLIDALKIESARDSMESTDELDNTKIIHSQVPIDKQGRPTVELDVVKEYYNAMKRALPEGSVPIVNPFDTNSITLNGTGTDGKFALLDKTIEQAFSNSGVSSQLFANDNASSQALEKSILVDVQWLYSSVLPLFTNYYNYELLKSGKKSGATWKVKFLNISHFDKKDKVSDAKDQLANGGSRMEYLASTGLSPLEIASMLVFEQRVLNIDDFMLPKQTSFTMSGDEEPKDAGRPESDNPTDKTVAIKDAE